MRKLMEKLQKQSQAMKSTQQEISSLKKQLSETTGFFKGKARKSLEYKIEQAQERFERIVEQMKQAQGITEQLKADNTWEWIGRINNIQTCAREIVDREIIYE